MGAGSCVASTSSCQEKLCDAYVVDIDEDAGEGVYDLPGQVGGLAPVGRLLHSTSGLPHPNKAKLQMVRININMNAGFKKDRQENLEIKNSTMDQK